MPRGSATSGPSRLDRAAGGIAAQLAGEQDVGELAVAVLAHRAPAAARHREVVDVDPERRLWGDTLLLSRGGPRRLIGSVIFHGRPDDDGVAEVGYGVAD